MTYFIDDPRKWRLSKSGFSIKTGWADEKKYIAKYPGAAAPLDGKAFQEWMDNAEKICDLYNASLAPASLPAAEDARDGWKAAVEDALVICCILNESHKDPRKAVQDLIDWHMQVAHDPLVSEMARDAAMYRWWRKNNPVSLLTSFYGNGCINKTLEGMEADIAAMSQDSKGEGK